MELFQGKTKQRATDKAGYGENTLAQARKILSTATVRHGLDRCGAKPYLRAAIIPTGARCRQDVDSDK